MTDANLDRIVAIGEPTRVDDLCPDCYLPSLWELPVYHLTDDVVHVVAFWRGCTDCGHRERRNA